MTGPAALRGLLIYAREEALTLERERLAELLTLAIEELSTSGRTGALKPGAQDSAPRPCRGSGYLQ